MTCKDCFHYEACKDTYEINFESDSFDKRIEMQNYGNMLDYCRFFKAKDKVIELPCKVGDTVWVIRELQDGRNTKEVSDGQKIKQISKNSHGIFLVVDYCHTLNIKDIGKIVFLTREEAEKALKELKENEK